MASETAFSRFRGVSDKLKNAIKPSLMTVALKLLTKGLIAQETYDETIDGRDSDAIKAAKIVNELQAALKIRDNPDKYLNEICDALREVEEPLITDMANKLSTGTSTPASTVSTSQATPHTVPSGIDAKIAKEVLNASGDDLKKIDLKYLAGKMLVQKIITDDQKRTIVDDRMAGLGGDERMDKLLNILKDTVAVNGSIFTWFIEILEGHNVASQGIAQGLQKKYEELLMESTKKKPFTGTSTAASTVLPQATPHSVSSDINTKSTTQKPQGEHGVEDTDSAGPAAPEVPAEHFPVLKYIQTEYKPFSEDLVQDITVLLMTATEIELRGIMGYLKSMGDTENDKIIETFTNAEAGKIKFYIGKYGQYPVVVGMSAPGKAQQGPLDACNVTTKLMNTVKPRYVIAVGICYGMDKSKTFSGDVIVANLICDYKCIRVGDKDTLIPRGGIPPVGRTLLQVFGDPIGYTHTQDDIDVKVHCGGFIARPDLVDNPIYKKQLKCFWPNALGGEMEGAGIMAAIENATYIGVEAIVIKAICDWGDGKKNEAGNWKPFSSHAAARYVHHQMNMFPGLFISPTLVDSDSGDAPETTNTVSDMTNTVSQGTIEKWLQEGEVDLSVTRINMHGASGSGKTCTQLLLLNEPPPPKLVTDSTSIACPAVQATRVAIDNHDQKMKWKKVTPAELVEQLASDLKEAPKVVSQPSVQEEAPKETKTHEQNEKKDKPLHHSDDEAQKKSLDATKKVNEDTGVRVDEPRHQSNGEAQKESTGAAEKVIEDIVKKIPHTKAKLSRDWAYFIDSGGQPAYRELLPLFSRTAALNIITIDLTKGLEKECGFEYRVGDENLPINTELKYSNLDIIRSTISSEAILKPIEVPYVTNPPSHPHYLVVGTREDDKEVKTEDIKAMNETLIIDCNFDHVIQKKNGESIIFPVNTLLSAGPKRKEASMELCKVISNHNVSMKIKIPIRLFAFEISLQKDAEEKERSILTKEEVVAIGKRLQLNKEEVEKALQYLHNVTIILYYPKDDLQHIIFVDPQPILNILSRLIAITYVDSANLHVIANSPLSQKEINYLHTRGCFKEDLLKKVDKSVFIKGQFEPPHMIALLEHLHIITQLENGDYFFPCALPSYDEEKSPPPSTEIKPLLVVWKNDDDKILPVPQGVFPLIVVHLLNQEVKFPQSGSNYYKCYDAMSLHVKVSKRDTLHIINRHTHIELYFEGDKKDCPKIWELVNEAIKNSSNGINAEQSYARAFKCPKGTKEKYCYCIVTSKSSTECTKCTSSYDILPKDDSYWCWVLGSQSATPPVPPVLVSPPAPPKSLFPKLKDIQIKEEVFSEGLVQDITVLLMTATPVELRGIMGYLKPLKDGNEEIIETFVAGQEKVYIGKYGKCPVVVGMSAPGKAQQGIFNAYDTTTNLIKAVKPCYVIAVGICYGMDDKETSFGDVIVSNLIVDATSLRMGNMKDGDTNNKDTLEMQQRGKTFSVEGILLNFFGIAVGYSHTQGGKEVEVRCGPIISRPDLVDNPTYKKRLNGLRPDALGGEMEGAGIMNAAEKAKVKAIVIKAICDWGDGKKKKDASWKPFSSHAVARYVHHQMKKDNNPLCKTKK